MHTNFTRNFILVLFSFCFFTANSKLQASHLVGADLTYNCLSGNTYELTLNLYRDCAGGTLGTTASIAIASASCGVSTSVTANITPGFPIEVSAICPTQINQTTCNSGSLPGIQQWQYKVIYTLPQTCTDWTFSYSNCCRNYAISTGPAGNSFYVQATLNNVAAVCNSSPDFTSLPVPYMCLGQLMNYNHGAFDINGDSLVYSLVNPMQTAAGAVTFNAPYNATYPLATNPANNFAFNTLTGQMTFVPGQIQQGVCAVRVREYRNGVLIGTVVRDIQMVVINCTNNANVSVSPISNLQNATVIGTNNIRVCAGELLSFNLTAQDPNAGTVISMVSNTTTAIPGSTFTTVGTNPKTGTFSWQTNANSTGYWNFTITISDNNCPVPSVQVYGFTINVFGVDIAASDYTYCPGTPQAVQLDASVGGSLGCPGGGQCYSWTPSAGLSATNIPNPIATVSSPTSYIVTYNDGVCIVNDTVTFVPEGSVTVSPANPVVCSGSNAQLSATNTFPSNNVACGSGAGVLCNGPSTVKIIGTAATNGATQYTSVTPYNGFWHDSRMQMLFTAAELTTAGTLPGKINSLVFNIANKYSSLSYQGFTIKMGCTNLTALNAAFQPTSVTCYSNTVNTFAGLNTYNFTTPFIWDGVSNLIVEICYNNTAYTLSDPVFYTATPFTSVVYNYGDNNVGCSMNGSLTSTLRPNIRFSNCSVAPPVNYTWTSIAGDPVSTLSATNIANPLASPTQPTTYVVACDNGSCVVYDTVTVTINPSISLNNIPDVNACPSAATTLTASGVGLTGYSWNTGQATASINVNPAITTTYTVTATSACGNLTDNVTVFAVDNVPPVINNCPANINLVNTLNACGALASWTSPNATDNCAISSLVQTTGLANGSLFPIGTTTVTYIATDIGGNQDTCTFTITVSDTELPVIVNCPANIAQNNDLGQCGAIVTWTTPTTTDNCPNPTITQTAGLASGSLFPLGTSTITYTATDANGNTATCSFTITITDTENPVLSNCPANMVTVGDLGACGAIINWIAPSFTDNCAGASLSQTQGLASGSLFPLGTSTIQYVVTDAVGLTDTCTFTITITDTEAPQIVACPANIVMTNDIGSCGAVINWTAPTTTDNCSASIVQTQGLSAGSLFPLGTTTIEYIATDASGNTDTCTFTITITDTENPVIVACPANISQNNDLGVCGAAVTWIAPTTTDNCPNPVIVQTAGLASGSIFPLGTSTIEYIATDASGNQDTCTFTITITDTELPVIVACPANIAQNNDLGQCGAIVTWTAPTTTDNCPNPTITQTAGLASGSLFPLGTSTITYTATDANGNTATCSFTITITDTENPVLSNCPANMVTVGDAGACGAIINWITPSFTDNCAGASLSQTQGLASGSLFPLGTSTIQYVVTDAVGLTDTCTFTITITDTEAPQIVACPANIVMTNDIGSCGAVVNWAAPTTTDNCSASIVQTQGLSAGTLFPLGTTTIEYIATDASGNTDTCTFTITITDTENPVIVACPANIAQNNDLGVCGAAVTWIAPTTTDNCPNPVIVQTAGLASGSIFPLGTSTIEYIATDASGNQDTCTFTITITDTELPVIVACPANIAQNNDLGQCGAIVTWAAPTTTDNCPNPTITQTAGLASGSLFPLGTSTITYTATDANGNQDTCTFTITITDTENPVLSNCPANIVTVGDAGACGAIINWAAPSFTDNCAGASLSQTQGSASGSLFPLGTSTIQYVVTDAVGLTDTCTFTITITDTEAPVITHCPADATLSNDIGFCGAVVTWANVTFTDNCSATIAQTQGLPSGSFFPLGQSTIQYVVTDASGNQDTCTFFLKITDDEEPIISNCPANFTLNNAPGVCGAVVTWTQPTVSDNCPNPVMAQTAGLPSGFTFPIGTTYVEYSAVDAAGNTDTCSFTITITDTENPVIANCPANITKGNDLGQCGAIVTWTAPTVTDNCPNATITQTAGLTSGSFFALGTSTITYIATDANGNKDTCTFTVTVSDTENPVIANCPANILHSVGPNCDHTVTWTAPTVSDNCPGVTMNPNHNSGDSFPFGATTVTYIATDAVGLKDTCTFTITVVDDTPPVINNCPSNLVLNLVARCDTIVNWAVPTATDNCSTPTLVTNHQPNTTFLIGVTTVTYIATDAAGLKDTCTFTVTVNPPPALNATLVQLVNPNCFGQKGTATVSATGGSGVYTYTWSSNPLQFGNTAQLANGNYIVTIKDALAGACVSLDTLHIQIIQPSPLTLSLSKTNPTCFGLANGDATGTVGGGTPTYTYTWNTSPVQSTATASNLTAGTYSLEVNDAKGCTITKTITLTQPDSLQGVVYQQNVKCFGDATGSANIQVSKGTPPYQFVWTGSPSTTGVASGLVAGTYTVTVTDSKGCSINRTFVISQPSLPLSATVTPKDADCFGTKTGFAAVNALGGTPAYTYTWNVNPVQFGINAVNLAAGNYTMTTRDANNCFVTMPFSIAQPPRLDIKVVNITHPYCDSLNGQVEVIATGGASPYQYQWNSTPPQTGVNLVNVGEGNYHAVVTDAGGCQDSVIANLNNTPPAQAAFTSTPTNDGEIVLNQANILFNNQSQGAVAYMWAFGDGFSSNSTNPSHIYQEAGTYTVTLTAFNAYYVCPTTYSLTYIIIPNGTIFVPNAFSPNNDGSNDLFQFMGEGIKNLDAQIYNRWGVLVHTLKSPSDTWNGKTLDGQEVPEGAYTYKANIELNDGSRLQRGGTVMVIR